MLTFFDVGARSKMSPKSLTCHKHIPSPTSILLELGRVLILTLAERAVQTHFSGEIQIPSLPQLTFSQSGVTHCGSLESHPKIKIRKLRIIGKKHFKKWPTVPFIPISLNSLGITWDSRTSAKWSWDLLAKIFDHTGPGPRKSKNVRPDYTITNGIQKISVPHWLWLGVRESMART